MSYDDKLRATRPAEAQVVPWDTARSGAPDPSWPLEDQLRWYSRYSHILLLNCSELTRQKAAEEANRDVAGAVAIRASLAV
jgi:hypothetical protein